MRKLAALLLLITTSARAGGGGDALPFLKIDAGARGAALSGAYAAAGDDALAVFYNPAGTGLLAKKEIVLGHNEWLEGLRHETAAYVHPIGPRLTAFGGLNLLLSGELDRYDTAGNLQNNPHFSALDGAVTLGLSGQAVPDFYIAGALKGLTQQVAGDKDYSLAADAGFLTVSGPWRLGASASNISGKLKIGDKAFPAPLMLRGGVSYTLLSNYLFCADAVKAGQSEVAGAFGAEARLLTGPKEYFVMRAGYRTGRGRNAGPGVTGGVGVTSRDLRVDYAFAPYGDLGAAHRVSISFRFGAPRGDAVFKRSYREIQQSHQRKAEKARLEQKKPEEKKDSKKNDGKKGKKEPGEVYFMW